jgi:hypothetical protein
MDENPYSSPREVGYAPPQPPLLSDYAKDRIALWVTGAICCPVLAALAALIDWLT